MKNWWNGISEVRSALSFFHIEMEPHWTANKVLGILTGAWGNGLDLKKCHQTFICLFLPCLQVSLTKFSAHFAFRAAHWHGLGCEGSHLPLLSCSLQCFIHAFLWFSNNCLLVCENPSCLCTSGEAPETPSCCQMWCGFEGHCSYTWCPEPEEHQESLLCLSKEKSAEV